MTEPFTLSLAPRAIGLLILYRRGMAPGADPEGQHQIQRLFIGKSELLGQLVHPNLLRQVARSVPSGGAAPWAARSSILACSAPLPGSDPRSLRPESPQNPWRRTPGRPERNFRSARPARRRKSGAIRTFRTGKPRHPARGRFGRRPEYRRCDERPAPIGRPRPPVDTRRRCGPDLRLPQDVDERVPL